MTSKRMWEWHGAPGRWQHIQGFTHVDSFAGSHCVAQCVFDVADGNPGAEPRAASAQVWVYGNSFENVLVAVVVPNEAGLTAWAEREGVPDGGDFAALCRTDAARKHVLAELTATGREGRLKACAFWPLCCAHALA